MTVIDFVTAFVFMTVAALLIGYATGRRAGFRQGLERGAVEAPLRLRHQALKVGRCPVCDQGASESYFE